MKVPLTINSFFGNRIHPRSLEFQQFKSQTKNNVNRQGKSPSPLIHDYVTTEEESISHGLIAGSNNQQYAYLRIDSFAPEKDITDVQKLLIKYLRKVESKTAGIVIDVRDNGGGSYGDFLVQFFSKIPVEPQTEEIKASDTNFEVMKAMNKLYPEDEMSKNFLEAIMKAKSTGSPFTERLPINKKEYLNSVGQIYTHPVIILTNPGCYSYCDYFTSLMQDHNAGEVWIINGKNTGGGGASVTTYEAFSEILPEKYPSLPYGSSYRIAFSNGYRTQKYRDVTIENNGAFADVEYWQSQNDVRNEDQDLWKKVIARFETL